MHWLSLIKNNPQRNQLLLRSLLGTIPVLINKSGTGDEFTHTSEQQWNETDKLGGNLPGFGEVNGGFYQLNKNLLAYFY
ncbi:MgPa adhesin [Mycoplasmoides genitalium M6282]|nr:MgPa adhesin [Mycoplasmoides genitalium M6282]